MGDEAGVWAASMHELCGGLEHSWSPSRTRGVSIHVTLAAAPSSTASLLRSTAQIASVTSTNLFTTSAHSPPPFLRAKKTNGVDSCIPCGSEAF